MSTLPRWPCARCGDFVYAERPPADWKWGPGGRICPACQARPAERKRKRPEPLEPRACEECGAEFQPKNRAQLYCGGECRDKAVLRRRRQRREAAKACVECGEPFEPSKFRPGQLYCSPDCAAAQRRESRARGQDSTMARTPTRELA